MSKPDLMTSKAQLMFPGWLPALQALAVTAQNGLGSVEMSWSDDGELILEVRRRRRPRALRVHQPQRHTSR